MTTDLVFTIPEVADRLHVSARTVRRLVHGGQLGHVRVGRRLVRISAREVERYIDENTVALVP